MVGASSTATSLSGDSGAPPAATVFEGRFTLGTVMGATDTLALGSRTSQTVSTTPASAPMATTAPIFHWGRLGVARSCTKNSLAEDHMIGFGTHSPSLHSSSGMQPELSGPGEHGC